MPLPEPFIQFKHAGKTYGSNAETTEVLHDINLEVAEGEFVAIVGYSGAGKTTLISMIAGLVTPDTGEVLAGGKPVTGPGPDRAIVFQNYSLLPWLTVQQNIALAVDQVFSKESAADRRNRVARALAMVNLSHAAAKKPSELSGGMRQRVSVARALSMDPRVLLLDEPLGALDALTRATIQDEITSIWQKDRKTVVLITNDVDEAILLADRIIPLSVGPAATLGPAVTVDLPRPRDRKAMNHEPRFKEIRQQVIEWLLGEGKSKRRTPARHATSAGRKTVAVGFLPLVDAAPLVAGVEREVFHKHGVDVRLQKFPSWDAITDALCAGRIDAAHMLASIPVAMAAGLMGHRRPPVIVPWILNRNGQGITLSSSLLKRIDGHPVKLAAAAQVARQSGSPLAFASTHKFGTHELWLRYWLAANDIDPDTDVSLTVVPPPVLTASLRQGEICGFCGGEPWNAKAVTDGVGHTIAASQDVWPDHPEKALAISEAYVRAEPDGVQRMLAGLHEASAWVDEPINKSEMASLLSRPEYCNVPCEDILPRLSGKYEFYRGKQRQYLANAIRFCANHLNYPQQKHAMWFLTQFRRWGFLRGTPDYAAIAARVFRSDIYEAVARSAGFEPGPASSKPETLVDGITYDPADPELYATGFAIGHPQEPEFETNAVLAGAGTGT